MFAVVRYCRALARNHRALPNASLTLPSPEKRERDHAHDDTITTSGRYGVSPTIGDAIVTNRAPEFLLFSLLACASANAGAPDRTPKWEASEHKIELASPQDALTVAQIRRGEAITTLLVVRVDGTHAQVIDLSALSGLDDSNPFSVVGHFEREILEKMASSPSKLIKFPISELLPIGPVGTRQIAAGANYPEHGAEAEIDEVFLFPKISKITPPVSRIATGPGVLLDYEVEICARFDRSIRSMADFEAATVGLFLCGDFSDRAELARNVDLKNVASGDGFADGKSGDDRFPVGALLVLPKDWKTFLRTTSISTHVNDERRQFATGGEMIKDLRSLVAAALKYGATRTWNYAGGRIPLFDAGVGISTDVALLTGTGEGVVFRPPSAQFMARLMPEEGEPSKETVGAVIGDWVREAEASRQYLQPGDVVRYSSNRLGTILVNVELASAR